jgi:hypothetical protein
VPVSGNTLTVSAPDHAYAEEGTYFVTVSVQHDNEPALTTALAAVRISDQQLTALTGPTLPTTGTEGTAFNGGAISSIATFTDAAGVEAAGDYTASISWGDGTTSAGTIVLPASGNTITVSAPDHTYAEEGSYSVTVTVQHDGLAALSAGSSVTISDPSVVLNTTALSFNAREGTASSLQAVATFTDPAGAENVSEYAASINWGDGTTSLGTISFNGGTFTVLGSHSYSEEGTGNSPITVTINHGTSVAASAVTANAAISDPSVVLNGLVTSISAKEGVPFSGQVVATFTDPAGPELTAGQPTAGEYSATIDWGDGVTDTGTTITWNSSTQSFVVTGGHAYAEEGTYIVTVTVSHGLAATGSSAGTATVNVSDVQLTNLTLSSLSGATEGANLAGTTIATFVDPAGVEAASDYTATISWGDGTTSLGMIALPSAGNVVSVTAPSHTYSEEGTYAVTVSVQHGGQPALSTSDSLVVADAAVQLNTTPLSFGATEGSASTTQPVATFTDPAGAENLTEYSATINWGDGTPVTTGTITFSGGTFTVLGNHTYAVKGSSPYQITVTVHHGTAADASGVTATSMVADVAPTITGTVPNQFTTDRTAVSPFPTVTIGDVDPNQQLTTTVAFASANGVFTPASLTASGFTLVSGTGATAQYQFVGTANATTAAIRQLVFQPTKYQVIPGQVVKTVFTITTSDGILPPVMDSNTSLVAIAAAGVDTLPFADNFNRPNASSLGGNWVNDVGAFAINNNQAVATGSLATLNGLLVMNSVTQVQLTLDPTAHNRAGLVTRYMGSGNGNYYWAVIEGTGSTYYARLYLSIGGKLTLLTPNAKPLTLTDGASTTGFSGVLRLEAYGSSLKFFVNGNLKAYTNNASLFGDGSVGIQGRTGARFDNFLADNIGAPPVTLPYTDNFTSVTDTNQLSYNWLQQAGAFTVASGVVSTVGKGLAFATLNNPFLTGGKFQADVSLQTSAGSRVGLVANYNGNIAAKATYYAGQIISNGGNSYTAQLDLYQNGVLKKVIKKQTFKHSGAISGTLDLNVSGGVLTLSLGTLFSLTGNDTTLTSGAAGMLGVRSTVANFSVM